MSPDELLLRRLAREIEAELANIERLGDYLRFRHVFRNVYGFVLDATRLKPLEENFNRAVDAFLTESRAFAGWLRGEG
jgi:hypothetical protein